MSASRIPAEKEILSFHPSWRGMFDWYVKRAIVAVLVCAVVFLLYSVGAFGIIWFILAIILSIGVLIGGGRLERQFTTYKVTNRRVSETTGILSRRTESALLSEITNTTVTQRVIERMLGAGSLAFDTAGEHLITRELQKKSRSNTDFLSWWGVVDPHHIASIVDEQRAEMDSQRYNNYHDTQQAEISEPDSDDSTEEVV